MRSLPSLAVVLAAMIAVPATGSLEALAQKKPARQLGAVAAGSRPGTRPVAATTPTKDVSGDLGGSRAGGASTLGARPTPATAAAVGAGGKPTGAKPAKATSEAPAKAASSDIAKTAPTDAPRADAPAQRPITRIEASARAAREVATASGARSTSAAAAATEASRAVADLAARAGQLEAEALAAARPVERAERRVADQRTALTAAEADLRRAAADLKSAAKGARKRMKSWVSETIDLTIDLMTLGLAGTSQPSKEVEEVQRAELAARDAARAATEARDAMAAAEAELASAAARQTQAAAAARAARTATRDAEGTAGRLTAAAAKARAASDRDEAEASRLETSAKVIGARYVQVRSLRDQHRYRVAGDRAARAAYRKAVRRTRAATFIESKPGESSQDALAAAPERGLFAIADGVTNSDFSGEFARALVRRWTDRPASSRASFGRWLADVQAEWGAETSPLIKTKAGSWYNRKREWKADAAFVGAQLLQNGRKRQLRAIGLGDTVMFLVRGGKILRSFPLEESDEFSDVVKALPSVGDAPFKVRDVLWDVKAGDEVFMATDALAAWTLREAERGRDPLSILRKIKSRPDMERFVTDARAGTIRGREQMAMDDTSLLRFVVPPGDLP